MFCQWDKAGAGPACMGQSLCVLPVVQAGHGPIVADCPRRSAWNPACHAHLAIDKGRYADAVASLREATELAMATLGPEHAQTAACWLVQGLALLFADRAAEALAASSRALEMTLKINGGNQAHLQVVNARVPYARALAANGKLDEAIAEMKRAIAATATATGPRTRQVGFVARKVLGSNQPRLRR